MSPTENNLIHLIANSLLESQKITWEFYAISAILSAAVALASSFLIAYMKQKGQQKAINEAFSNVKEQLEETTRAVKKVESEISQRDWIDREWRTIRMAKLEELYLLISLVPDWLHNEALHQLIRPQENRMENPFEKAATISTLYFPELSESLLSASAAYNACHTLILNLRLELVKLGSGDEAMLSIWQTYTKESAPLYTSLTSEMVNIRLTAFNLLHNEIFKPGTPKL
ncbi:hypothetical protein ABGV49_20585 [Chromobacterium vaccinii]|uniref:Uncharacterized protein n=1 Tax=Chromobacterium vaccinii TaxID=1108595 RepID=A0ABV0FH97_9NEIS